MPQISIITVNKDNASGLIKTVESVVSQTYTDYEWIVIDAASKDGSVDLIKQYAHHISYWVSEPDGGIYAGMNKGIAHANGEYLIFLNSGDTFADAKVLQHTFEEKINSDIVIGQINFKSYEGKNMIDYAIRQTHITLFSLYLYGIPHQATFIRKKLFDEIGLYDTNAKIVADWKFFVDSIINHNCSYQIIPVTIANFDDSGLTSLNAEKMYQEKVRVFNEMFPPRIVENYNFAFQHHYDIYRLQWLLKHPFIYKLNKLFISLGMRIIK